LTAKKEFTDLRRKKKRNAPPRQGKICISAILQIANTQRVLDGEKSIAENSRMSFPQKQRFGGKD